MGLDGSAGGEGLGGVEGGGIVTKLYYVRKKIYFNTWEKLILEKMQTRAVDFNPPV